jgi:hypothetical protein
VKRDLSNPVLRASLGTVKKHRFLIQVEKCFLDDILGLAAVADDASCNGQHEASVAAKENLQGG